MPQSQNELPEQTSKQVSETRKFTKNIFAVRTCPSKAECLDEVSEKKPSSTVTHSRCKAKCVASTKCGAGRDKNCDIVRNSAMEWLSVCQLGRCFTRKVRGKATKCCEREECSKPKTCKNIPGKSEVVQIPIDDDIDSTVDLGTATFTSDYLVKKCITIPNVPEDIYLLTDQTGSMGPKIGIVRDRMQQIIDSRKEMVSDVRFGVGSYGDEEELGGDGFRNRQTLTSNSKPVKSAISKIKANAGGDNPEAGLVALYRVATDPSIGWRSEAQKVVVIFGDCPQHEPTCVDGSAISREDVVAVLNRRGISVVSIDVGNLNGKTFSYQCKGGADESVKTKGNQMIDISRLTDGLSRKTRKLDEIIATIEGALDKLTLQFLIDVSDCSKFYDVTFDIGLRKAVMRGEEVCFKETIKFKPDACQNGVSRRCDIEFTASGPLLGTQTLKTNSLIGCPA